MSYAAPLSRTLIVCTLAVALAGPAPRAEARGERGARTAQRRATAKRVAAFDQMLDRIWAQKVTRNDAAKRQGGELSKGLAGSVRLEGNRVIKTVVPKMDLRSEFGWMVGRGEMQTLVDQEVAMQRKVSRLVPGFTPRVFSYEREKLTFAMEFVPGKHLDEITKAELNRGALGRFEKNLSRVHRAGIGHGDIKPANIMIVGGEMKLIDWGTARKPVARGGKETVMDHFLRRSMGHPGPVDLIAYDQRALQRVEHAVANLQNLPAAPAPNLPAAPAAK